MQCVTNVCESQAKPSQANTMPSNQHSRVSYRIVSYRSAEGNIQIFQIDA